MIVWLLASGFWLLSGPAWAAEQTVSVDLGRPLEISMPPSDALAEWVVQDYPVELIEQVSVQRLPAETVFVFRPLLVGTGTVRFIKKVVGASGAMSEMVWQDVDVMVTGGPPKPAEPPGRKPGQKPGQKSAPVAAPETSPSKPGVLMSDPLILDMLTGQTGFPAKNPEPILPSDTEEEMRRKNPLPYSLTYVFPKGSYLLNPTHRIPLPDTPPGFDTAPPAYHQALQLARRGLFKEAGDVLDGLVKELKARKTRNASVEQFYQFVTAHIHLSLRNYEEAIKRFKDLYPSQDYGRASRFYAALATEYAGDTLGAITGYQGVMSYNPEGFFTPESAYRIGRIFFQSRAYDRAVDEFVQFMRDHPRSPFIDDTLMDLARIYDQIYHLQNFDVSLKLYETLINQYGESPYLDTAQARKKFILENYF